MTLRHVVPATPGDSITFTASIDSVELAPIDVLAPTEYIVGECHALVHVTKTFDDGAGSDGPLGGWAFEVRRAGALVATGLTEAAGELTLELTPGTYVVSEILPYDCVYPGTCVVDQELECNVLSCDPLTGNVPDLICTEHIAVAYGIIYAASRPVGTVRCAQELDGTVGCDEISPGKLRVFEGLFCPGVVEAATP